MSMKPCNWECASRGGYVARAGWRSLLESQGFDSVAVAGEEVAVPPILERQSVVMGVSDGVVRIFEAEDALVPRQLPAAAAKLPASFLPGLAHLPIR